MRLNVRDALFFLHRPLCISSIFIHVVVVEMLITIHAGHERINNLDETKFVVDLWVIFIQNANIILDFIRRVPKDFGVFIFKFLLLTRLYLVEEIKAN